MFSFFLPFKFQTKSSSTNATLATYVQYGNMTSQKKNEHCVHMYIIYIVNETKKTCHQCMLNNMLKGFLESSYRLVFKCCFFHYISFSFPQLLGFTDCMPMKGFTNDINRKRTFSFVLIWFHKNKSAHIASDQTISSGLIKPYSLC